MAITVGAQRVVVAVLPLFVKEVIEPCVDLKPMALKVPKANNLQLFKEGYKVRGAYRGRDLDH